jgi:hypothetical protein
MIKSRRIRQVGHVACKGDNRNAYRILMRDLKERPLGGLNTNWITLRCNKEEFFQSQLQEEEEEEEEP